MSRARGEDPAGSASTFRAFLLIEDPGPWGVAVLRDSRLPVAVRSLLAGLRLRALLIRRHERERRDTPGIRVFAAWADPHEPWLETAVLDRVEDLLDHDLAPLTTGQSLGWDPHPEPVFAVCTHGRHDVCCAEKGRPVARALSASHPHHTWEVSHIGGDRFAANVLVLPDGIYYGRVDAERAASLADRHLDGRLALPVFRGRSGYAFPVQAAEIALRREADLDRVDGVRLLSATREGSRTVADFEVRGRRYRVTVERSHSADAVRMTCGSERPERPPVFETRVEYLPRR